MMINPSCDYFNEERDDEYAPPYGECEECYRYDICRKAQIVEELLSGNMANINLKELHSLVEYFPDRINTLMIQKSSDDYCVVVDDISVRREQDRQQTSRGEIMRDINVTKYRKLLYNIQYFCSHAKWTLSRNCYSKRLTDFERGVIQGKHTAYKEVLKELNKAIEYADIDWEHMHCREEYNT